MSYIRFYYDVLTDSSYLYLGKFMKSTNIAVKMPLGNDRGQSQRGCNGNFRANGKINLTNIPKSDIKLDGISITIEAPENQANVQSTLNRIAEAIQVRLETLPLQELEQFADHLESTVNKSGDSQPKTLIGASLDDSDDDDEKVLEFAALHDYFEWRQDLLKDALTAPQVAKLLNISRQTPHDRLKKNTLIAVQDNGVWKFPVWQFDASGADGVIPGLSEVLKVLNIPDLSKISWLTQANGAFDGRTPVDALKDGRKDKVVCEARTVGVY
jgi:hypothetical protein